MVVLMFVGLKHEEIIFIVLVVARDLPEINVEHVGSDHLLVASSKVLVSHEINKPVIDFGPMGEEKGTAWGKPIEEEETLGLANDPVVSFESLYPQALELRKLVFLREGNAIDSLKLIVLCIS